MRSVFASLREGGGRYHHRMSFDTKGFSGYFGVRMMK